MVLDDTNLYFGIHLMELVRSYLVNNKSEYTLNHICNSILSGVNIDKREYKLFRRRVANVVNHYLSIQYVTKVRDEVTPNRTVMYIYQTNFSKIDEYSKSINS